MAPFPAALSELPDQVGQLLHRAADQAQSKARDSIPTATRPLAALHDLVKRQSAATVTVTVTATPDSGSGRNGATTLSAGAIAGIIIGSVVGVLLLLWIFRSCMNIGAPPQEREAWYHDVEPTATKHRRRGSGGHHHRSHSREVRASSARPPVVVVRDDTGGGGRGVSKSPRRPSATYAYEEQPRRGRSGRKVYETY